MHEPDLTTAEALAGELGIPLPALVARDDQMAQLIAGFAMLPKAQRQTILSHLQHVLGAEQAEQVRAKLVNATPMAKATKRGSDRRL